jgi:RimJ/RimL family protein N-acetyltransferase
MITRGETTLRLPEDRDLALLTELRNDVELQLLLASRPRGSTPETVREWLAGRGHDGLFFVIADAAGQACGYIQLIDIDPVDRHGRLGICLAPSTQRKGHGASAMAMLEAHARDLLAVRKIVLSVLASNQPAIVFYKELGYREVGVHQQHFFLRGHYHDVLEMEKLL